MKNFIAIIVIALCTLSVSCTKSENGRVFGTASSSNNETFSGIKVMLYDDQANLVKETTTNSSGFYEFNNVEEGNYYLGATMVNNGSTWDTGNRQPMFFVGDNIDKEVSLTLGTAR